MTIGPKTKEEFIEFMRAVTYELKLTYNENLVVTDPGKFQGESILTPYFYSCFLEGDGEYLSDEHHAIVLQPFEKFLFPLESAYTHYLLTFSNDGFVSGEGVYAHEVNELREEISAQENE